MSKLAPTKGASVLTHPCLIVFNGKRIKEGRGLLGLTLEQTRVYQEAKAEGRVEREAEMLRVSVPLLLKMGMSPEQIAQELKVDVEAVRLAAQQST